MAEGQCCRTYSLVLMDINMPVMDGIETTKAVMSLVQQGKLPRQNVVALTGDALGKEAEEELSCQVGFIGYYTKPISKKTFLDMLRIFGIM